MLVIQRELFQLAQRGDLLIENDVFIGTVCDRLQISGKKIQSFWLNKRIWPKLILFSYLVSVIKVGITFKLIPLEIQFKPQFYRKRVSEAYRLGWVLRNHSLDP